MTQPVKLVTFVHEGEPRLGALSSGEGGGRVFDLNLLDSHLPFDMIRFLGVGKEARESATRALVSASPTQGFDLTAMTLRAPIPRPGKILCIGQNYLEHAAESNTGASPHPIIFSKFSNSVIGPGESIVIPPDTDKPDYEGELAVVIGERACRVPESKALDYVADYMPFNDVSARDWQQRTRQWLMGET